VDCVILPKQAGDCVPSNQGVPHIVCSSTMSSVIDSVYALVLCRVECHVRACGRALTLLQDLAPALDVGTLQDQAVFG